MPRQQFREEAFVNRRLTALQRRYFRRVVIDSDDLVSKLCQAGRSDQSYIARSNHCDLHDPQAPFGVSSAESATPLLMPCLPGEM
jgi:hypothetical protein